MRYWIVAIVLSAAAFSEAHVERRNVKLVFDDTNLAEIPSYSMNISYLEANPKGSNTIVFVHGNSASKDFFEALMHEPDLRDFHLVAIDLPGHGESSDFPQKLKSVFEDNEDLIFAHARHYYTFVGYANVVNRFMTVLDIDPAKTCVFGWSLGGHVAIDMLQGSKDISQVVLTGTPIADFKTVASRFDSLKSIFPGAPFGMGINVFDLLSFREHFTPEQAAAFHALGGVPKSATTQNAAIRTDPFARYFMIKFASEIALHEEESAIYPDQESTVRKFADRILILQGGNDPIKMSRERVRELGLDYNEIPGVGHATFIEAPRVVAGWLRAMVVTGLE